MSTTESFSFYIEKNYTSEFKGFNNEQIYFIWKEITKSLLNQGKIDESEYKIYHKKLVKKYKPIMSKLMIDISWVLW